MKTPNFWQHRYSIRRILLEPVSWIYHVGHLVTFHSTTPHKLNIPVICVGNLTVGGTGKTPIVAMLAKKLTEQGCRPHIISRGYSGNITRSTLVVPEHTAQEVGDEPLLLAQYSPVWIGKNRVSSALAAHHAGADVIIMDDGFQNPSLHKDFSILAVDGAAGFGNHALFPAGALRERLSAGIKRADMLMIIGEDKHAIAAQLSEQINVTHANIVADVSGLDTTRPALAFCGIGRPEKFYDTLRQYHIAIADTKNFPDHHHFTQKELTTLADRAASLGAYLLTTEKDWLRLDASWKAKCTYLPITLEWGDIETQCSDMLNKVKYS